MVGYFDELCKIKGLKMNVEKSKIMVLRGWKIRKKRDSENNSLEKKVWMLGDQGEWCLTGMKGRVCGKEFLGLSLGSKYLNLIICHSCMKLQWVNDFPWPSIQLRHKGEIVIINWIKYFFNITKLLWGGGESEFNCWRVRGPVLVSFYVNVSGIRSWSRLSFNNNNNLLDNSS